MNRLSILILMCCLASQLSGCGQEKSASSAPYDLPSTSTPSTKPLPSEYRTLAKVLRLDLKSSPDEFRDQMEESEWMAEMHSAILDLKSIESNDSDISYISNEAKQGFSDVLEHTQRISSLPKPKGSMQIFVESFIDGFLGNVSSGISRGLDAEEKANEIINEINQLMVAVNKADSMQLLLPKVAEKYTATFCDSTGRIVIDFDESWGSFGPHDWLRIYNSGEPVEDCTIVVELTGVNGEKRKNVHYLERLPSKAWMIARYEDGMELLEKRINRTTVENVSKIDVTLFSPQYATLITYDYKGEEFDKDVAAYCKDLKITGNYQPFVDGIFWDTERGVKIKLEGVELIPECVVNITFRNDKKSKAWIWKQESWTNGEEKTFSTPQGELTYDPTSIAIVISFPDTAYTHKVSIDP